jgi:hypothetical protein
MTTSMLKAVEAENEAKKNPPARPPVPADTQQVCIDLPGEVIQCYIHKSKLEILLRKHRDVVFDLKLFKGASYTVEAEKSDFYNVRDKQIVQVAKKQKVTFSDGEQMHLHVGRNFEGNLVLKSNGKVLGRYQPNGLDKKSYGDDPYKKPEPLSIVMHNAPSAPNAIALASSPITASANNPFALTGSITNIDVLLKQTVWIDPLQQMIPSQGEDQTMHVVEIISKENAPPEVLQFFMDGGEAFELDANKVLTQNWILSQVFGAQAYMIDNRAWAKELMGTKFRLQRIKHKAGIKNYIVFKGHAGLRKLMNASKYALTNTKIVKITAGAGSVAQTATTARNAMNDSVKVFAKEGGKTVFKAGGIAVLFTIGMDTAEWYKDYSETGADGKPKKDFTDLFTKIGLDIVKAGLSAAIASAIVATLLTGAALLAGITVGSITLVVVGTILVAVGVGYLLDLADKKLGQLYGEEDTTALLSKLFKKAAYYLEEKLPKEEIYKGYGGSFDALGNSLGVAP